jgi:hypothetical protein
MRTRYNLDRGRNIVRLSERAFRSSQDLRQIGKVTVNSWGDLVGATKLYEAAGRRARVRIDNWERKG